ncbi:MAG: dihydropteroate synthase [Aestuariivirga sp.]
MPKTYVRPSGLVYGPDARRALETGSAGLVGGHSWIAYTLAEIVERDGESFRRSFASYRDIDAVARRGIERMRAAFGPARFESGPAIMGIVNVTPDSFSDGGQFASSASAVDHGEQLTREGAIILDVGGESTRPGSDAVPDEIEVERIVPVIDGLAKRGFAVSADTRKSSVMRSAVSAGAFAINDVSALTFDPESLATIAKLKAPVVLMHAQGDPRTMQLNPRYADVALDVYDYLEARISACVEASISRDRICIDPGIGFGKTFRHNLEILQQLTLFHGLGVPLLVGASRKGFIGALTGEKQASKRAFGSAGIAVQAALNGVHILRVHDVKGTVDAVMAAKATADPEASGL